jgi:hypothetical protein
MLRGFQYVKAYRQGEILIFKLRKNAVIPYYYGEKALQPDGVIKEGEKTGHEHEVEGDAQLTLFGKEKDEGVIDVGKEGATVTHPEHGDIKLDQGKYVVKTQKEAKGKHGGQSVRD